MALKAVIFDMDGLMLDTERIALIGWKHGAKELGIDISDEFMHKAIGMNKQSMRELYYSAYDDEIPFETLHERSRGKILDIIDKQGIGLKQGLLPLLDYLDITGIRKAVGTSTSSAGARRNLTKAGILDRFEVLACGDEVENGKPAPDIFLLAAKRLNLRPDECIVLEDSENGVRAAYAAGIRVIVVPDIKKPSLEVERLSFAKVASLYEAIDLIDELV